MKTARLSLHHLTAMEVGASELVGLAARSGCQDVCLFTYMPAAFRHKYPLVERADAKQLAAKMQRLSIGCLSLEVFPLTLDADFAAMERSLEIGAMLGARYATVHSHLEEHGQARDMLGRLAEIARIYSIRAAVEFNPFSKVTTLAQAAELIGPLENSNVGLVLDTLHAARAGTQPAAISAVQHRIDFVQISDGPAAIDQTDRWKEAMSGRSVPGTGELPLMQMLAGFEADLSVSIEVPREGGEPSDTGLKVLEAVKGARKTLELAGFETSGE